MPATSLIGLGMWTLDKTTFENESAFQMTLYLARTMLEDKLITEAAARAADAALEIIARGVPAAANDYNGAGPQ